MTFNKKPVRAEKEPFLLSTRVHTKSSYANGKKISCFPDSPTTTLLFNFRGSLYHLNLSFCPISYNIRWPRPIPERLEFNPSHRSLQSGQLHNPRPSRLHCPVLRSTASLLPRWDHKVLLRNNVVKQPSHITRLALHTFRRYLLQAKKLERMSHLRPKRNASPPQGSQYSFIQRSVETENLK